MKPRVTRQFRDELHREWLYYRQSNPRAAALLKSRLLATLEGLKQFPESGRGWRIRDCRELIVPTLPYVIIYRVDADTVVVLSLFHTSRKLPG